ncbi:DUF3784 domain-containing protein [Sphingobacterium multivorum]|nr:DUF3784 domain-containing protein [Sphingobacterium multivorum]QQT28692.1 DUF3784 domain-containing protein [Sphingobacterium multivorum]QQT55239.1 DUF3784 domain-containing protein [Sphingobacterium multivorum]
MAIVINEKNARYILAGYNSMSEIEKQQFELVKYLKFFKNYLLILAVSYIVIGVILFEMFDNANIGIIFSVLYPFFGFFLLIYKSLNYYRSSSKTNVLVLVAGTAIIIAIITAISIGLSNPTIKLNDNKLFISGPYGKTINIDDILSVEKISTPIQTKKISGFQMGNVRKGKFELPDDEIVTIISTSDKKYLMIFTKSSKYIIDFDSVLQAKINEKLKKQ